MPDLFEPRQGEPGTPQYDSSIAYFEHEFYPMIVHFKEENDEVLVYCTFAFIAHVC